MKFVKLSLRAGSKKFCQKCPGLDWHTHCDHCRSQLFQGRMVYRTSAHNISGAGRYYCEPCGNYLEDTPSTRKISPHNPALPTRPYDPDASRPRGNLSRPSLTGNDNPAITTLESRQK